MSTSQTNGARVRDEAAKIVMTIPVDELEELKRFELSEGQRRELIRALRVEICSPVGFQSHLIAGAGGARIAKNLATLDLVVATKNARSFGVSIALRNKGRKLAALLVFNSKGPLP